MWLFEFHLNVLYNVLNDGFFYSSKSTASANSLYPFEIFCKDRWHLDISNKLYFKYFHAKIKFKQVHRDLPNRTDDKLCTIWIYIKFWILLELKVILYFEFNRILKLVNFLKLHKILKSHHNSQFRPNFDAVFGIITPKSTKHPNISKLDSDENQLFFALKVWKVEFWQTRPKNPTLTHWQQKF